AEGAGKKNQPDDAPAQAAQAAKSTDPAPTTHKVRKCRRYLRLDPHKHFPESTLLLKLSTVTVGTASVVDGRLCKKGGQRREPLWKQPRVGKRFVPCRQLNASLCTRAAALRLSPQCSQRDHPRTNRRARMPSALGARTPHCQSVPSLRRRRASEPRSRTLWSRRSQRAGQRSDCGNLLSTIRCRRRSAIVSFQCAGANPSIAMASFTSRQ